MSNIFKLFTSLFSISLCSSAAFAGVYTDPVGVVVVPIKGAGATTIISNAGLLQARAYKGTGDVVSGDSLVISTQNWDVDAYAGTHYVQLENGEWSAILSNTADTLTLETSLQDAVGVMFKIHPLQTLDLIFGNQNDAGFTGGGNLGVSDIVALWDQGLQDFSGFYYYNTARVQWEDAFNNYAGNTVVYPDEAMVVIGQNDKNLLLKGEVQLGGTSGFIVGDADTSLVPNPYPVDLKISQVGLEGAIQGGSTEGDADWILIWDADSQTFSKYYYDTDDSLWKNAADDSTVTDLDVIASGTAAVIIKNSTGNTNWEMTQPFTLSN